MKDNSVATMLAVGLVALLVCMTPALLTAQDLGNAEPQTVTIDNLSIEGSKYSSVTIRSDTPLVLEFQDEAPQSCEQGVLRWCQRNFACVGAGPSTRFF